MFGTRPVAAAAQSATFNVGCFKMYGAVLAVLAVATLALGIADVVMTMQNYCTPWVTTSPVWCTMTGEPYIWTWVASGIWGSVPIFLAGLFAMCIGSDPAAWTRGFALLTILSAIVFAPAIIILTSIELWRDGAATYTFYTLGNSSLAAGTIMPTTNPYQAKFAIPLAIAILGGLMFLMTLIVTLNLCCCMETIGIYLAPTVEAPVVAAAPVVSKQVYLPPRPQVRQVVDYQPAEIDSYGPGYLPTRFGGGANFGVSGSAYGRLGVGAGGWGPNNFGSDFFQTNPPFWR